MPAGYDLTEGICKESSTSEELWSAFSFLFSSKSINSSSYKFGFLKSITDNLYEVDEKLILSFDQLFSKFAEIYWNLILKYKLQQSSTNTLGRTPYLEQILMNAKSKYEIPDGVPYESLSETALFDINKQIKQKCKTNVVGALFADTQRLLYSFNKKEEWIQFSPSSYDFMCNHKLLIEKLNYYEWAKYLEKVNDTEKSNNILTKLDESTIRTNLNIYRHILYEEFEQHNCFYCGKKLTHKNTHVDHFIPWSFIKSNNTWNFVLACSTCNIKKNDKLADNLFLDKLIERNKTFSHDNIDGFQSYSTTKLRAVYSWAKANGYNQRWKPTTESLEKDE